MLYLLHVMLYNDDDYDGKSNLNSSQSRVKFCILDPIVHPVTWQSVSYILLCLESATQAHNVIALLLHYHEH